MKSIELLKKYIPYFQLICDEVNVHNFKQILGNTEEGLLCVNYCNDDKKVSVILDNEIMFIS